MTMNYNELQWIQITMNYNYNGSNGCYNGLLLQWITMTMDYNYNGLQITMTTMAVIIDYKLQWTTITMDYNDNGLQWTTISTTLANYNKINGFFIVVTIVIVIAIAVH